jgi:hypothetical protein
MWRSDHILPVRFRQRKRAFHYGDIKPQRRDMGSQESAP